MHVEDSRKLCAGLKAATPARNGHLRSPLLDERRLVCLQSFSSKLKRRCQSYERVRKSSLTCRADDAPGRAEDNGPSAVPASLGPSSDSSSVGKRAALGAVALGVAAFAATRLGNGEVTLKSLERKSMPLDTALRNHRPTVVEFYANWCEICRELTPEVYKVEEEYKNRINFVMLNIENPKWAPEMAEYRVSGIPHFLFLNGQGRAEAAAVGRLPLQVLERNVEALIDGKQLPFRRTSGETSSASSSSVLNETSPRSHS